MARWQGLLDSGISGQQFLRRLTASHAFRSNPAVRTQYPTGHYCSPVGNPATVDEYLREEPKTLPGIDLQPDAMEAFWRKNRPVIAASPFKDHPDGIHRYAHRAGPYNHGDGITLWTMLHHHRPRRVVEIGSGFSTACMLDTAEHAGLDSLTIDCIEPDPTRLRSVLRPGDERRVTIHARGVQLMPLALFSQLDAGDLLFIDSTHVLKTGSDVHHELFHILPILKPGVMVHFHDCRYPLEYSQKQIFARNLSWNEAYAVRALLLFSNRFRIAFWGSYFAEQRAALIRETNPTYMINPGSALWLEVLG